MKFHRHLFLEEVSLAAAGEWKDASPGWRFVRISHGVAYWLERGSNKELAEGEVIVLAPHGEGFVRASQIGGAQLHFFQFSPELLAGFFTLAERHHLDEIVAKNQPAARFLPVAHQTSRQFAQMIAQSKPSTSLFQRCDALCLAVGFFADEVNRHKPPAAKSTYAMHRFRQLIQQMPEQQVLNHTPEQLAQLCGCSLRHFGRLFRKHFGASLRSKQTELRLLMARQLLLDSDAKIIQVAMESGYRSLGLFNVMFKRAFGMTPTEWRKKHARKGGASKRIGRAAALLLLVAWPTLHSASAADAPGNRPGGVSAPTPPPAQTNKPITFPVKGYEIRGNSLLSYSALEPIFKKYTGAAVSLEDIQKALSELQLAYRERGYVTASVALPKQQLTDGLVKVQVTEGRLAEIDVINNRYFSSNNVMRSLPVLRTNVVLNGHFFQQELNRANNNRDRQIYPVIGPGPDPGTSTLNLKVVDQLPLHGRAEIDNFSTPDTPELRMNLAVQYNNLWQLEHQLGVQYSFAPEEFKQGSYLFYDRPLIANYSTFYRMPLSPVNGAPERTLQDLQQFGYDETTHRFRAAPMADAQELLFFASRSSSDTAVQLQSEKLTPETIPAAGALQVSDRVFNRTLTINQGIGARLLQPVPDFEHIHSSFSFGPDFKRYRSQSIQSRVFQATLFVPETGSAGPPFTTFESPPTAQSQYVWTGVDYLPFSFNWEGTLMDRTERVPMLVFNVNNSVNWSAIFNSSKDFRDAAESRKATGDYYVGNYGVTHDHRLPYNWSLHLHADGQYASQPLLSTEQFGSGGNSGVRGYRDGQLYTDAGWRVLIEPRTPLWNLGKVDGKADMLVRLFAFTDYGQGYLLDPGSRKGNTAMWGAGFGFTGTIGRHFDCRLTVGIPILDLPSTRLTGSGEVIPAVKAGTPRVTFALGAQF